MLQNFYNKYIELNLKDYFDIGFDLKINKVLFFVFLGLVIACIIVNYVESGISLMLKRLLRTETHSEASAKTLGELGLKNSRAAKLSLAKRGGMAARLILVAGERRPSYEEYIALQKEKSSAKKQLRRERMASIFGKKKSAEADAQKSHSEKKTNESLATVDNDVINELSDGAVTRTEISVTSDNGLREEIQNTQGDAATNTANVSGAYGEKINLETARFYIPEDMKENAQRYLERRNPTVMKTVLSCVAIAVFYVAIVFFMPTLIDIIKALSF